MCVDASLYSSLQAAREQVIVRLHGFHNRRNLGGSYSLGISLDGQTIVAEGAPEGNTDHNGTWTGISTADLRKRPEFQQVRHFYVPMRQTNTAGTPANPSSRLDRLEIEATCDKAVPTDENAGETSDL
jgi:hypothetical protein